MDCHEKEKAPKEAVTATIDGEKIPYSITPDGRLWSHTSGRLMTPEIKNHGYVSFQIRIRGKQRHRLAHRIVCETFNGQPPVGSVCMHLDGNPLNNHRGNLGWGTQEENCRHKRMHGTMPLGARHWRAKLTATDIPQIRRLFSSAMTIPELAHAYEVSESAIKGVVYRKNWKHID